MQQNLLTTKQAMEYFQVKDSRTIKKFIKQGLKYIPIGSKDYRFKREDLEEFTEHLKELAQQEMIQIYPVKRKTKCKTINIDYEKLRINRELNKVVWKECDLMKKQTKKLITDIIGMTLFSAAWTSIIIAFLEK